MWTARLIRLYELVDERQNNNELIPMNWAHAHTWLSLKMVQHRRCNESRYNICQTKYARIHEMECENRHSGILSLSFSRFRSSCVLSNNPFPLSHCWFLILSLILRRCIVLWLHIGKRDTSDTHEKHFKILQVTLNIVNVELLQNLQLICSHETLGKSVCCMWSNNENKESRVKQPRKTQPKLSSWGVDAGQKWRKHLHNEKLELKESFNGLKVLRHFLHM